MVTKYGKIIPSSFFSLCLLFLFVSCMIKGDGGPNMKTDDLLSTIEILCAEYGKLGAIIESSYNGVFEIDEQGNFLSTNSAFLRIFDIDGEAVRGLNFFHVVSSGRIKKAVRLLFAGKEKNFSQRLELKLMNDKKRFVDLTMK